MEALTAVLTGAQLAVFTLVLAWLGKGRFEAIDRRLDRIEAELVELRRDLTELRRDFTSEMSQLRRDFNQLVLGFAPPPRPQTG